MNDTDDDNLPVPMRIERMYKNYKTHRSAIDFNHAFIGHTIRSTTENSDDHVEDECEEIIANA